MEIENQHEKNMISFYDSLSEKDRRRYSAIEAQKHGHGGITYISALFGCDEKTIGKGMAEINDEEAMSRKTILQKILMRFFLIFYLLILQETP